MVFTITARDKNSKARAGILHTKSGDIETPFFMPVATKTAVKFISSEDLKQMGANAIISNAFILSLKPGVEIINKMGGIRKFMNYHGINFTDSGGFQMYSSALYIESKEEGVYFRDPFSGIKIFMTPEENMEIQIKINSDVAMCLDSMPLIEHSKEAVALAVERTKIWAERCKKHHDKLQTDKEKKQLLFGIIQGGVHKDLREKSARDLVKMDFSGYSIGGLALGEEKNEEYEMIEICKKYIPEEKPVYLMGAGNPLELLEAISRGCDMFDSRFPTRNARHGSLYTSEGKIGLKNKEYGDDSRPIDPNCQCSVCKNYTRAYLSHLLRMEEPSGLKLASYHNLYFLQDLMAKAREAIKKGTFIELLEKYRKMYKQD